ncbi:hypothetical protein KRR40_30650 [Niabella defluvii]|nr:hypothetical protein KRR40_30650 [Niabella sp. I65]
MGWTSHHSIIEYKGNWYLFYHDSSLSKASRTYAALKLQKLNTMKMAILRPWIRTGI